MIQTLRTKFRQTGEIMRQVLRQPDDEDPFPRIAKTPNGDEKSPFVLRSYTLMEWYHRNTEPRRNGESFIVHPIDVGNKMLERFGIWGGVIGFLHDILEDNQDLTPKHLLAFGFPIFVVRAVETLTRKKENGTKEPYTTYIERIARSSPAPDGVNYAIKTKIIDIKHNLKSDEELQKIRPLRPEEITKNLAYRAARKYLKAIDKKKELKISFAGGGEIFIPVTTDMSLVDFTGTHYGYASDEYKAVKSMSPLKNQENTAEIPKPAA